MHCFLLKVASWASCSRKRDLLWRVWVWAIFRMRFFVDRQTSPTRFLSVDQWGTLLAWHVCVCGCVGDGVRVALCLLSTSCLAGGRDTLSTATLSTTPWLLKPWGWAHRSPSRRTSSVTTHTLSVTTHLFYHDSYPFCHNMPLCHDTPYLCHSMVASLVTFMTLLILQYCVPYL